MKSDICEITVSIVLYDTDIIQLEKAVESFKKCTLKKKLILLDNSPDGRLKDLIECDDEIRYIFTGKNLGYGSAHNIAIKESLEENVKYHLALNPDVYFGYGVLEKLYEYMERNPDAGEVMPKVVYPDGRMQFLAKLLPTPVDLIFRRFIPFRKLKDRINEKYELNFCGYDKICNIPCLSGCFMFLRVDAIKDVGIFDEKYFMYMEDVDLNRRLHSKYRTIFYPEVEIFHEYTAESYRSYKMLVSHIRSAVYYFNKWGWFFDRERKEINQRCLRDLNYRKQKTRSSD